nr:APC family permease [Prescottella subtropica]
MDPILPERLGYRIKCRLLGPPLTTARLHHERLSKTTALGVLSPDCISSSAYGPEQALIELLPFAAMGAFVLLLPITGAILVILLLLTLSYRQVVMLYTRAGGSYVVARENFGPRIAQIAAVALLIDYVVTVAVQSAAGTVAVVSAIPALGPYSLEITVGAVLLLAYGNLRGLREAGRAFAFPMYFFTASIAVVIVVGVVRAALGTLDRIDPTTLTGTVPVGHGDGDGLVMGATVLVILRAFANGGTSLTGLEAISNGVSAFRKPAGPNARRALVVMASILAFLVAGVSLLAYLTHATPYLSGYPSVISQEARIVFGSGTLGDILFVVVQTATALILFTGANTSFNGFPFLASFVADDAFLPRQLRRRGHRLVFSNAIIMLTAVAIVLLVVTDARVNSLVPFYAIGVFTGFTMAGLGMARHHSRVRGPHWRWGVASNLAAGITSAIVVLVFAVAKFTDGAWVVLLVFPTLVFVLIRLNREYRDEAVELRKLDDTEDDSPAVYSNHVVLVLVDAYDLATVEALRYGRSLRPSRLRAVHFALDDAHAAHLARQWENSSLDIPLDVMDCPDRRLGHALLKLIARTEAPRTEISILLPRRTYSPLLGRLLHDRTADHLAGLVSDLPHTVATIVPFDARRHRTLQALPAGPGKS